MPAVMDAVLRKDATRLAFEHFYAESTGVFLSQDFHLGPLAGAKMGIRKTSHRGERGRINLRTCVNRDDLDELTGTWHSMPL